MSKLVSESISVSTTETENKLTVGEEFVNWAEKYWDLKIAYDNRPEDACSENCPYIYIKDAFALKIDEIIKNRL